MSAYIVDVATMREIVQGLVDRKMAAAKEDASALGEALFKMNVRAVECRYGSDHGYDMPQPYKHVHLAGLGRARWMDSIKKLRYQCSEGRTVDEDLYVWLSDCIAYFRKKEGL